MPTTKKSSRKGMHEDEKSKSGKSQRGRSESQKSSETNTNREGTSNR